MIRIFGLVWAVAFILSTVEGKSIDFMEILKNANKGTNHNGEKLNDDLNKLLSILSSTSFDERGHNTGRVVMPNNFANEPVLLPAITHIQPSGPLVTNNLGAGKKFFLVERAEDGADEDSLREYDEMDIDYGNLREEGVNIYVKPEDKFINDLHKEVLLREDPELEEDEYGTLREEADENDLDKLVSFRQDPDVEEREEDFVRDSAFEEAAMHDRSKRNIEDAVLTESLKLRESPPTYDAFLNSIIKPSDHSRETEFAYALDDVHKAAMAESMKTYETLTKQLLKQILMKKKGSTDLTAGNPEKQISPFEFTGMNDRILMRNQ